MLKLRHHVSSRRIQDFLEIFSNVFFQDKNEVFSGEQEKRIHYSCEDGIEKPSIAITVRHLSAGLVLPNGDPRDGFFLPTLTLMIDSYNINSWPGLLNPDLSFFEKQKLTPSDHDTHCFPF